MDASPGSTASGLRDWWAGPARRGPHRLINPWEYRHLRFSGAMRVAGGSLTAAAGIICLSYGAYRWAAFFLFLASLNVSAGYWFLTIDRDVTTAP